MDEKEKKTFGDFLEEMRNQPPEIHQAMKIRDDTTELILDGLTDGFVKAFHEFGRRAMAQSHLTELDCDDCGALLSFTVIAPVNDFRHVLKEILTDKDFQAGINKKIKKGSEFNNGKGYKIRSITGKDTRGSAEVKGHNIKID